MITRFLRLFAAFRDAESGDKLASAYAAKCNEVAMQAREDRRGLEAEHKAVCQQLQDVTADKLSLQDRMDALANDRDRLWDLVSGALSNERRAYQLHINETWQKQYGVAPYPDAPQLPHQSEARAVNDAVVPGTMLPGERVRQQTSRFLKNYYQSGT